MLQLLVLARFCVLCFLKVCAVMMTRLLFVNADIYAVIHEFEFGGETLQ